MGSANFFDLSVKPEAFQLARNLISSFIQQIAAKIPILKSIDEAI
jgi:hypothetical protein